METTMKCEFKYAPKELSEVIFFNAATATRIEAYATGALSDSIILWGPNGTGKSTIARLLIKSIGGDFPSVETKTYEELIRLDDLRFYLKQAAHLASMTSSKKHFLLLEEFDSETKKMEKFWTAMDSCGDSLMVIITTNNPNAIHKSLRSRLTMVECPALTPASVLPRAQHILRSEGIVLADDQVLHYLRTMAVPLGLRKYMRVLDQIIFLHLHNLALPPWQKAKPQKPILSIVS
jgi:replication-associated recombination protein RarA